MLNKAVTLYRLVFLFVSRRDETVTGDEGESGKDDIVNGWEGGACGFNDRSYPRVGSGDN